MYSPLNCAALRQALTNDPLCVVDVGASTGIDPMWRQEGLEDVIRFTGIEPHPGEFAKLKPDGRTRFFDYAISDWRGETEFFIAGTNSTFNKARQELAVEYRKYTESGAIQVRVERLDWMRESGEIPALDAIKSDAEDHDGKVFSGAGEYLGRETLFIKSEFCIGRTDSDSSMGQLDALFTKNGFIPFGFQLAQGPLLETYGGDLMYLRSIDFLLEAQGDADWKRTRIFKLLLICYVVRNMRYSYVIIRAAADAGLLSEKETEELVDYCFRNTFLPDVLTGSPWRAKAAFALAMVGQLLSGHLWVASSSAKINRLTLPRPLFRDQGWLPSFLKRRLRERMDRFYAIHQMRNRNRSPDQTE